MKVNALDLSPNYSGTLMAMVNGIGAFTGIITPYIVAWLAPHSTLTEWQLVFWIVFGVFIVSNFIFVIYASGEVQFWNDPNYLNDDENRHGKSLSKNELDNVYGKKSVVDA